MGWIKRLEPSKGNAVSLFATEIPRPVDIKVGPDGTYTLPFSVVAATAPGNNAVILFWSSEPGESYQVQLKNALSDLKWINVGPPIVATSLVSAVTNGVTKPLAILEFRSHSHSRTTESIEIENRG